MKKHLLGFDDVKFKQDWKTLYRRYRIGRLKHQYWLWNRKRQDTFVIDEYDHAILQNCKEGTTVFYASSGYYLKELFPEILSVEQHDIVKSFYEDVIISSRENLANKIPKADNFAIVNNRAEQWYTPDQMKENILFYTQCMNEGCRFFYSFRDTQIPLVNRLTTDLENMWLNWALSLESTHDLKLVWSDIQFPKKIPNQNNQYDTLENPDTTNGNIKFWFVYKGVGWTIV